MNGDDGMKTVTLKSDNRSILIAQDVDFVSVEGDHVKRNEERIYGIGADTVTLYESVSAPIDWSPSKYFFDGEVWTLNPDWIDIEAILR